LPDELIAKTPANPRNASRLLVFDSKKNSTYHKYFSDVGEFLNPGDLLVVNNSKVMPSRIFGRKISGLPANASQQLMQAGGKVEILLLEQNEDFWQVLIGGKTKVGDQLNIDVDFFCQIIEKNDRTAKVKFNLMGQNFWRKINQLGHMPIPPYIKNSNLSEKELRQQYQTVYAKEFGSAAAPTAGLHFTKKLIGDLRNAGVEFVSVDLHVGLGTFAPINEENVKKKKLHSENFSVPHSTVQKILKTKMSGGRIIAVGTTTVRALESISAKIHSEEKDIFGSTDIFIWPGDKFKIVDGLITNFHLPKSSLMMLVAAFIQHKGIIDGRNKLLELYKLAIDKNYRFYSFGDAMLIV